NGCVYAYPGNYEDYVWRKQGGPDRLNAGAKVTAAEPEPVPVAAAAAQPEAPKPQAAPASKDSKGGRLNPIKLRQMKERRRAIEDEVTRLEVEIADYEAALSNFRSAEETQMMSELLNARRSDLEALLIEWEEVAQTIEANS